MVLSLSPLSLAQAQDWSVLVVWTAPGDDGSTGTAAQYDVRYSTDSITDANWALALQSIGEPTPRPAGRVDSFLIRGLLPVTKYYVAVKTRDEAFNWSPLSNVVSKTTSLVTGVGDDPQTPTAYELRPNYPNPFNPGTTISCYLSTASHLTISIFNLLGQHIVNLVDGAMAAGPHTYHWDGTDATGRPVASGIYLYRMDAAGFSQTRRMSLIR